ncbi:DNA primase [Natranaerobius thermophilus]|uniref:DNA primase n=1 Tax=Natranaerobius thermophilus (strain ATCC BAA-1301 / DSM 18059 / JW/NM-WN-LF) TaxID=457570 RepID=B2A1Z2_NATTJ|nr:DNA primase [Natranaerobius thermophilus]ACB84797.1 DNA primase [Natranaerobius thermophilus JW/NM-WN-LF]
MTIRIPQEIIERIQAEADLVEIASRYVNLKKQGKYYWGLCPFHSEKTPSFHISPEKQLYYCFGCQAGGNVFKFLESIEQLNFVEVCQKLGEELGIELPADSQDSQELSQEMQEREIIKKANKYAANFFRYVLMNTETGKSGRKYLADRKIDKQTMADFFIGYAPDNWTGLSDFLKKKGFTEELLVKAGLSNRRKYREGVYDRFRGRVIFPIYNQRGEVIGFGGRLLEESEKQPKYLNSPETPVFNKRLSLYGLNLAFKTIRKENHALVMEGYTDVITAHQFGVNTAVASLGTSLTEEQAKLIRNNASKAYIAFDADAAGETATLRGLEILQSKGLDVLICQLPESYDPDEYLKNYGLENFQKKILDTALPLTEYQIRQAAKNKNLSTIEGKKQYVTEIIPIISKIDNAVEREEYLNQVSEQLGISQEALNSELMKYFRKNYRNKNYRKMDKTGVNRKNKRKNNGSETVKFADKRTPREKAEEGLVALMLHFPEYTEEVNKFLYPEDFSSDTLALIVHKLYQLKNHDIELDLSNLTQELRDHPDAENIITKLGMKDFPQPKDIEKFVKDCVFRIKESRIKSQREELQKELSQINPDHEPDRYREILRKLQDCLYIEKTKQWTLEEGG